MSQVYPSIAAIIPVKNGFPEIKDCIEGLLNQSVPLSRIIVIDSGSTDGTLEYLKSINKVEVKHIDPSTFSHGLTRNLGLELTNEELLYYTVQDARPVDSLLLQTLINTLEESDAVAVCGQQVTPHDLNKNPLDWFFPITKPEPIYYQLAEPSEFDRLSPEQKKQFCSWDNVNALYKRSALEEVPFEQVVFGEDMIWAKRTLLKGRKIAYNYNGRVYHYHLENPEYTFKRLFTTFYFRYVTFGLVPNVQRTSIKDRLKIIYILLKRLKFSPTRIWKWYSYTIELKKAAFKSSLIFNQSLAKGMDELEQVHEKYCGKAPVPLKNTAL